MSHSKYLKQASEHFSENLKRLADNNETAFDKAVEMILKTKGHLIISGIGKSGLIAQKISSSLASTGTPSFFMHPSEALHGDLGMITDHDTILLVSNSGETSELLSIMPSLERRKNPIISLLGNINSTIARSSEVVLNLNYETEFCPNNLAPTTSTLQTMALGDALTVALIEARQFKEADFARFHPGGALGKRLVTQVKDIMHTPPLPYVESGTLLSDALVVMSKGRLGLCLIMQGKKLEGIMTDGDLRRSLLVDELALRKPIDEFMAVAPIMINENAKFAEAEMLMRQKRIKQLVATSKSGEVTGVIEVFDE